jgi:hypothetical protein
MSSGFKEKYATSEPDIRADPINSIRVAIEAMIILVETGWNETLNATKK